MISLIVAVAENGVIGDRNALLWHISEDLRHFKAVTTGHPVVMGRKTWESLGRPLPNRTNVVITRQNIEIPGCTVVHSLEEAVALFPADEEVFVIGGAQIYAAALPLARKFYLTRVFRAYEGDTRFPAWDEREWRLVAVCLRALRTALNYAFIPPPVRPGFPTFAVQRFFLYIRYGEVFRYAHGGCADEGGSSLVHELRGLHGRLPGGRVL